MSSLLSLSQTLESLNRLTAGIRDCSARTERLEQSRQRQAGKLEQQHRQQVRELEKRLETDLAELNERTQEQRRQLEQRHQARRDRLTQAQQSARQHHLQQIHSEESREVFRIQRELLQVTRDHDAGKQNSDANLAAFQTAWDQDRQALDVTDQRADQAFRGYPSLRKLLSQPGEASPTPTHTAAEDLRQQSQAIRTQAELDLTRFLRLPLPRLFSTTSIWLLAGLALGGHAMAVFLVPQFIAWSWELQPAALSLGVTLAVLAVLFFLGGRLARPEAQTLAAQITQARAVLEIAFQARQAEHQQEHLRIDQETESRTESLQAKWNLVLAEAEQRRTDLQARMEQRLSHAQTRNDQRLAALQDRRNRHHEQTATGLRNAATTEKSALVEQRTGEQSHLGSDQAAEQQSIQNTWQIEVVGHYRKLVAAQTSANKLLPAWDDPSWNQWTPPQSFLAAAPFGRVQADLAGLTDRLPSDDQLQLPGDPCLSVPLLLTLPQEGSILLETANYGRSTALAALNNLVLRLLLSSPPGRTLFTILDPVGLGESFAGLMHLTDHEDRLINRRIWTQPEHIEQRLADLNEHIEKVTQLYLRNDYRTIAEYNEQAGRIAEPFHFLTIADFPVSFSDLAVRRLLSIASSGPRCGVFTLVHWDTRKPAPLDFVADDLRRASVNLRVQGSSFTLPDAMPDDLPVGIEIESSPDPSRVTELLKTVGQSSVDSNRVEMPFQTIAPTEENLWTLETTSELRASIGVSGATKLQYLALGKGTRQHVLIAGKTGSGKSTLFHVLVTNLALWSGPDQVEFYLVDFKKGVEFKCYATHRLPHARVVAIESDREFALSVLQRVDEELHHRGDLFRQAGVQDLPGYRRNTGQCLPRTLLVIDEFQEFFTDDDRVSQTAALLLDRLVRQGRAFGIHVLLGSQTLGGAYTLARTTLGQMVVRIALQCNQADALLIMDEDNPAPRLLSRPGEAIYNDTSGTIEGNSPFQIVWLSEEEREQWLTRIQDQARKLSDPDRELVVFEGNSPADVQDNGLLHALLQEGPTQTPPPYRAWLGAPNAIKGPTEVGFQRQNGSNLLVVGQNEEASLSLLSLSLLALSAQHPVGHARFILFDATPADSPHARYLEVLIQALPQKVTAVAPVNLEPIMRELAEDLANRSDQGDDSPAPNTYLIIHQLQRFKGLRYEDDFSLTLDTNAPQPPGAVLNRILTEGTHLGMHVLCACDSHNNTSRFLSRKALSEFELRVLFQMSASDSASLMDDPKASTLGLHRALLHNAQAGSTETFRPYALPSTDWLRHLGGA